MSDELRPFGPSAPSEPPEPSPAWHVTPRLVLGLGIVAFGVLLLLDNLELLDASRFLRYLFPCVLLGIGATVLGQKNPRGWFWLLAGGWMLLGALDIVELSFWRLFFPAALVFAGGTMVSRGLSRTRRPTGAVSDREQVANAFAFMSGNERRNDSSSFRGGDLFAFMGGVVLDLRQAKPIPEGAIVDAFAMWGGVEIRVPENWRVVSEVVPLLGGFEDKTRPPAEPSNVAGRLTVRGVAIMGGIEVKN